jgi:anti-sigma B factor antagonist
MDEPSHLQIDASAVDDVVVITLGGELDLASAAAFADAIDHATSSGAEVVIVDLRGLEFMDSTGIGVIVRAHQAAPQSGYRFAVVKGSPQVDRILSLTGLDEQITLLDAPEELLQRTEPDL